jgi:hypothetical protein
MSIPDMARRYADCGRPLGVVFQGWPRSAIVTEVRDPVSGGTVVFVRIAVGNPPVLEARRLTSWTDPYSRRWIPGAVPLQDVVYDEARFLALGPDEDYFTIGRSSKTKKVGAVPLPVPPPPPLTRAGLQGPLLPLLDMETTTSEARTLAPVHDDRFRHIALGDDDET